MAILTRHKPASALNAPGSYYTIPCIPKFICVCLDIRYIIYRFKPGYMQFGKLVWKNSRLEKSKSFGKQISTLENQKMVWKTNQYIGKPKNGLENKLVLWKNQNRLEKNSTLEKSKIVRKKYEHGRIKKYFVISVASDCIQVRI